MLVTAILIGAVFLGKSFLDGKGNSAIDHAQSKLNYLKAYINTYYLGEDEIDESDLENGIYKGYVEALGDPYSTYYTKEEYEELLESQSGEYRGIGVMVSQNRETGVINIVTVYDNTPAEEAGVLDGDILYKVEEEEVTGVDLDQVVTKIKGEEGTTVHITIYRPSTNEYIDLEVTRRTIQVPTVEYEMVDEENKIGYISITQFEMNTDEMFSSALEDLKSQGMKSVVFDLRNNPGGLYESVCNMLDELLPEGTIVYTLDKNGRKQVEVSDAECLDIPMAVLINGESASASEIFAGAVQDYKVATIIGTQSFGKGIVQSVFPLKDGSAIKLTVSKYYTPNGVNIHKKGITPDIEMEDDAKTENDEQLDRALEELRKKN